MRLEVRGRRIDLDDSLRERVTRRLHFALGRFAPAIRSVRVRLVDEAGPKGGEDMRCRVSVELERGGKLLVIEDGDPHLGAAIDRAASRTGRTVARELERMRAVSA